MFTMRCQGVEHFLGAALPALKRRNRAGQKDLIEISVNVRDWPQSVGGTAGTPVFSFSKHNERETDIMYPAWAFWEGPFLFQLFCDLQMKMENLPLFLAFP